MPQKEINRYVGEVLQARITERGRDGTMKARAENYLGIVVKGRPKLGSIVLVASNGLAIPSMYPVIC